MKAHSQLTGNGPTVICLHSSTSSGKQWQPLVTRLSGRYRVVTVDLYGYGRTRPWGGDRPLTLDDEVALFADAVESAEEPVHLVGHSYGGAVAVQAALRFPHKVASLTLYEPVLFGLLEGNPNSNSAREEIGAVERVVREQVAAGQLEAAAERFIDFWSGSAAWRHLAEWRKAGLVGKMTKVVSDFDAVLGFEADLEPFRRFERPTLLLAGLRSPTASRRVVQLLLAAIPRAEFRGIAELGHMGPVTHPDQVNRLIDEFLGRVERRRVEQMRVA